MQPDDENTAPYFETDDADAETTVPYLEVGEISVYLSEDEPPRVVPAHRYGLWAYVPATELGLTRTDRKKAKASPGARIQHIVHVPSGRSVATLASEARADELARALAARCPDWCSSCSLGDTPDDGEAICAMVMVIAKVAPIALVGGQHTAEQLAKHHQLANRLEEAGAFDAEPDEGFAA